MNRKNILSLDDEMDTTKSSQPTRSKREEKRIRKVWDDDDWDDAGGADDFEEGLLDRF